MLARGAQTFCRSSGIGLVAHEVDQRTVLGLGDDVKDQKILIKSSSKAKKQEPLKPFPASAECQTTSLLQPVAGPAKLQPIFLPQIL